jgi:hypothetical protein
LVVFMRASLTPFWPRLRLEVALAEASDGLEGVRTRTGPLAMPPGVRGLEGVRREGREPRGRRMLEFLGVTALLAALLVLEGESLTEGDLRREDWEDCREDFREVLGERWREVFGVTGLFSE